NIQANADSIDVVATNVATNTTDIATNVTNIQANADSIDVVATNVSINTANILSLDAQIQINQDSIQDLDIRIDSSSNAIQAHVLNDLDTDTTNELITSSYELNDTLFIVEGATTWEIPLTVGDNLGDHVLDSNLNLNGLYLSGDGDDEGIRIDTGGNVGIGLSPSPSFRLSVDGAALFQTDPLEFVRVSSYGGGFEVVDPTPGSYVRLISDDGGPTYSAKIETQTPQNNAQFGSDFYGDSAFVRSSGQIVFETNGGASEMLLDNNGRLGLGVTPNPDSLLDVFGGARVQALNINSAYSFPTSDGNNDDVLVTDGAGQLSFVDPATLFAADTLPIIRSGDSSTYVSTSTLGQVDIAVNDSISYIFYQDRIVMGDQSSIFIGDAATGANNTNINNIGIGVNALGANTTGFENIALGSSALALNQGGILNTAVGALSMNQNVGGNINTAFGRASMNQNQSGWNNVAIGADALFQNQSGSENTAVGAGALFGVSGNSISQNTAIGYLSGEQSKGNGNVFIGNRAGQLDSVSSNRLMIDNSNTDSSLISGDFALDILQVNGTFKTNGLLGDTLIYPNSDGTAGQVIVTDGSGNLSFGTAGDSDWDTLGNYVYNLSDSIGIGTNTPVGALDVSGNSVFWDSVGIGIAPQPWGGQLTVDGSKLGIHVGVATEGTTVGLYVTADNAGTDTSFAIVSDPSDQGSTEYSFYGKHGTLYNQGAIGIGTDNPESDLQFGIDAHLFRYLDPGSDSGIVISHNLNNNMQNTHDGPASFIALTQDAFYLYTIDSAAAGSSFSGAHPSFRFKDAGIGINEDSPEAAVDIVTYSDSLAIFARSGDASFGAPVMAFESPANGNRIGISIPDSVIGPYKLILPDTAPTNGQVMAYNNALGRLEWTAEVKSPCPSGYASANGSFCIETTARTGDNWFEAADTCASYDAKLPSWSEWYVGTQVGGVDWAGTNAWEWIDQASQNNASIVGGGSGASTADERQTVAADDPISPSNTVQYRCVVRIRN
ncbi:MAG: hypothetical protein RLP15_06170, partial [Cryomorphaceae bacterium]